MISLGLRLTISGGREAVIRLVILVAAVGLGVGLLLAAVSGINAVNTQNDRHAWFWTGTSLEPVGLAKPGTDPLWWHLSGDIFAGQQIDVAEVAATGPTSPVPPGLLRDPAPGQYYASPALARLLRSTPADELADRYPGRLAGTIGDAALPSPDSLVIIIGRTAAQIARTPNSVQVTAIATTLPGSSEGGRNHRGLHIRPPDEGTEASGIDLILSVVALALLAPVLIFIATATRLSAARREQRFAAMRLVGATPRKVSVISAVESTVAAAAGVAAGFGLFFVLRIPLAAIPFTGEPFFPGDLSLSLPDILAVAIGVPVAAAVVARLALRRVNISPLGVTRRVTPKPPQAWRVLPLLAGLAELGFFVVHGRPPTVPGQIQAFLPGFGLIMHRPGHRRAVADHGRRTDHGPAHQPPQRADRRPQAGRRPAGRVPRGQRPGPGPVRHHRGRRGHHHAKRQGSPTPPAAPRPPGCWQTTWRDSRCSPTAARRGRPPCHRPPRCWPGWAGSRASRASSRFARTPG